MSIRMQNFMDRLDYLAIFYKLSKPRIVLLLNFTTITALIVASDGLPDSTLLLNVLIGSLAAPAGASALNQYFDRHIDLKMRRTASRPIPSGQIRASTALLYGLGMTLFGVVWLGTTVNGLTGVLALLGSFYYVGFYTLFLKRNTSLNIVIGGGAGAFPILVGWSAATGSLSLEAWLLFAIVFYWTPPHSWALALLMNDDYLKAGIPMMPAKYGKKVTHRQIVLFTVLLVIVSLLPLTTTMFGAIYMIGSIGLGCIFLWLSVRLWLGSNPRVLRMTWKYSTAYLALIFLTMMVDSLL